LNGVNPNKSNHITSHPNFKIHQIELFNLILMEQNLTYRARSIELLG